MSEASNLKKVHALVAPIIHDLKLDLYDLEFRGGTLRVTIDTPPGSPGGVDLEAISLATRLIGREFDHHDPIPGHYTLEVTSPGLERTLRTPAHYQREVGKTVALRLRDSVNTERRIQGVLVAADDTAVTVRPEPAAGKPGAKRSAAAVAAAEAAVEERVIPYTQIDRARTVFVWGSAPKPGPKPAGAPKKAAATSTASPKEDAR
jgi:ribosome maturation factor RimP